MNKMVFPANSNAYGAVGKGGIFSDKEGQLGSLNLPLALSHKIWWSRKFDLGTYSLVKESR